jgi:uncharacterized protein (DUF2141 family)
MLVRPPGVFRAAPAYPSLPACSPAKPIHNFFMPYLAHSSTLKTSPRPPLPRRLRWPLLGLIALAGIDPTPPPAAAQTEGTSVAGELIIHLTGLPSDQGQAVVLLYRSGDGFPVKEARAWRRESAPIAARAATLHVTGVPYGTYAFTVYQDMNANRKLDTNFIGIPKEPVGVSKNARGRLGPPRWKDANFELNQPVIEMNVTMVTL